MPQLPRPPRTVRSNAASTAGEAPITTFEAVLAFSIAAGLLTMTPGLDVVLVLRTAALEGPRRASFAALGVCAGCLIWGVVVALGIGALLAASELAYAILRWLGAAYLLYLGATMAFRPRWQLEASTSKSFRESRPGGVRQWFVRGLLTNLLNPKVGVFYVTFLPQFVPPGSDVTLFIALLAVIHAGEGIVWLMALILATGSLSPLLHRPAVLRALDRTTGAVLILCGLRLALESRR